MKKNSVLLYSVLGIFFAIFNILAFFIPSEKTATFWIAYGFTVVAFISQIFIFKAFIETSQKEKFSGLYAFYIGPAYLLFQLIVFFLFKFVSFIPVWVLIIICTILFGLFLILLILGEIAKTEIISVEQKVDIKVLFLEKIKIDVELLLDNEKDDEVKSALEKLAKSIRYSDPMSDNSLVHLEKEIKEKISMLSSSTNKNEDIAKIETLLSERNKKCKILK